MFSDGPPSFDAVTVSRTWPEVIDVNTFTSSGMIAPASVPHEMIADSFPHRPLGSETPAGSGPMPLPHRTYDTRNVSATDTIDVSHTSAVSGCSKFILSALP